MQDYNDIGVFVLATVVIKCEISAMTFVDELHCPTRQYATLTITCHYKTVSLSPASALVCPVTSRYDNYGPMTGAGGGELVSLDRVDIDDD